MIELPRVTVVIPTIQGRGEKDLLKAIHSVEQQTYPRELVDTNIVFDAVGDGPAVMRNYGVKQAKTEWIAFLDDDDYLLPKHLDVLMWHALRSEADVVWPWFRVEGGTDPFPMHRGRQWDPENPHIFPITTLVRKEIFDLVGGFPVEEPIVDPNEPGSGRVVAGEDWLLWNKLSEAGASFLHVDEVTWVWRHHGRNTSGLPSQAKKMYGGNR